MRDFTTVEYVSKTRQPQKLIIAPVRSHGLFWPLFSSFVSPELQQKELKDSQADLMMQNTNKSPQPGDTVKNALTTARGSYGELRRMSHIYLSKSNSGFFSPSSQRPRWEI